MNTKEFFKVNDNTTANEVALIMGTIKKASMTTQASSKEIQELLQVLKKLMLLTQVLSKD